MEVAEKKEAAGAGRRRDLEGAVARGLGVHVALGVPLRQPKVHRHPPPLEPTTRLLHPGLHPPHRVLRRLHTLPTRLAARLGAIVSVGVCVCVSVCVRVCVCVCDAGSGGVAEPFARERESRQRRRGRGGGGREEREERRG
eukprot:3507101-Rhodomonas_salina.1